MTTDIMVADPPVPLVEHRNAGPLVDLRNAKYLPIPEMQAGLTQYISHRKAFREWLMTVLKPGVHYGTVPGCEPKFDDDGNLISWTKDKTGAAKKMVIGPNQWQWRPSLYKAGAQLLMDLFNWRPEFQNDKDTWEMLGKPRAYCCVCRLVNQNNVVVGEGRGARDAGQKGGNTNNVIKMAEKCAEVDAVIRTLAISDLFTQDDPGDIPPNEQPEVDESAPKTRTRSERITGDELKKVVDEWKRRNAGADISEWQKFVEETTRCPFQNITKYTEWTRKHLEAVQRAMAEQMQEEMADDPIPF